MNDDATSEGPSDFAWKASVFVVATVAGIVTGQIVNAVWRGITRTETPLNRVAGSATRRHVIAWLVASGVAGAVARLVAQRCTAAAWKRKTGKYPRLLSQ